MFFFFNPLTDFPFHCDRLKGIAQLRTGSGQDRKLIFRQILRQGNG